MSLLYAGPLSFALTKPDQNMTATKMQSLHLPSQGLPSGPQMKNNYLNLHNHTTTVITLHADANDVLQIQRHLITYMPGNRAHGHMYTRSPGDRRGVPATEGVPGIPAMEE